jgi:hypothetical protein
MLKIILPKHLENAKMGRNFALAFEKTRFQRKYLQEQQKKLTKSLVDLKNLRNFALAFEKRGFSGNTCKSNEKKVDKKFGRFRNSP